LHVPVEHRHLPRLPARRLHLPRPDRRWHRRLRHHVDGRWRGPHPQRVRTRGPARPGHRPADDQLDARRGAQCRPRPDLPRGPAVETPRHPPVQDARLPARRPVPRLLPGRRRARGRARLPARPRRLGRGAREGAHGRAAGALTRYHCGPPPAAPRPMSESELSAAIERRRTFAIISHPDAGKTTLTEKLLLFGGAIQMAGTVKGRKAARHATSDWMRLEQERGISVTSSVMQFPFGGRAVNLLDTPGHEDFSEDTYRTLTAVDSALMVIDCAKGVEERTIKLMEVCRLRATPIMTFINKLDRDGRPPIELLDEIERVLGIRTAPITWPI